MNEYEIIVNSCDSYEDVWAPFFYALRENWKGNIPRIILNTETKKYELSGLRIERPFFVQNCSGISNDWGSRLRSALMSVQTDYVLMLFDDYILEGPVDTMEIDRCISILSKENDICVFYLINPFLPLIEDRNDTAFCQVKPESDYILNSAPGLWRKSDLLSFVKPGDNPWAWEYFGSARLHSSKKRAFALKSGRKSIYPYQYFLGGAIYRGKWVTKVIKPIAEKYGLVIDYSLRGDIEPYPIPHSFDWKIRFFLTGLKMIGFNAFPLTMRSLFRRISRNKNYE